MRSVSGGYTRFICLCARTDARGGALRRLIDRSRASQQEVVPWCRESFARALAAWDAEKRKNKSEAAKAAIRTTDWERRLRRRRNRREEPESEPLEAGDNGDDPGTDGSKTARELAREKWSAAMPALVAGMKKCQVARRRSTASCRFAIASDETFITKRKLALFRAACACCVVEHREDAGETLASMDSGGVSGDDSSPGAAGTSCVVEDDYDTKMIKKIIVISTHIVLEIETPMEGRLRCKSCGFTITYEPVALGLWPTHAPEVSPATRSGLDYVSEYFVDVNVSDDCYSSLASTTIRSNELACARELAHRLDRTGERGPRGRLHEDTLRQLLFKHQSFDAYMLAAYPSARLDGGGAPRESEAPVAGGTPREDEGQVVASLNDEGGCVDECGAPNPTREHSIVDPAASCPACSIASFGQGAEKPILHFSADGNAKAVRLRGDSKWCDFDGAQRYLNFDEFEFLVPFRIPPEAVRASGKYDDLCKPPKEGHCSTYVRCAERYRAEERRGPIDERSMVLAVCHHGFVMRGTALIATFPERFDMYDQVLATIARTRTVGDVAIDFACKYGVNLNKRVNARVGYEQNSFADLQQQLCRPVDDEGARPRFMTGWMHGASHTWDCQRQHFGVFKTASARRAGETTEHIWSRLVSSWPRLRSMSSDRRTLILEHTFRQLDASRRDEFPESFGGTATRLLAKDGKIYADWKSYKGAITTRIKAYKLGIRCAELHSLVRRLVAVSAINKDAVQDVALEPTTLAIYVNHMYMMQREHNTSKCEKLAQKMAEFRREYNLPSGPDGKWEWPRGCKLYIRGDFERQRSIALQKRSALIDALLDVRELRSQLQNRTSRAHTYTDLRERHTLAEKELLERLKAYNSATTDLATKGKKIDAGYPDIYAIDKEDVYRWSEDGDRNAPWLTCFGAKSPHSCVINLGEGEKREIALSAHSLKRLMYLMARVERNIEEVRLLKEERRRALTHYDEYIEQARRKLEALEERAQVIREALRESRSDRDEKELWSVLREMSTHKREREDNQAWKELFEYRLAKDGFDQLCENHDKYYANQAEKGYTFEIAPRSTNCDVHSA